MNKLAQLIAAGEISIEELADAKDLIERANLVKNGVNACRKTIMFPLGTTEIECYRYMDSAGEYEAWGSCTNHGIFTCYCNWGGNHVIGKCNLTSFVEVYKAFENEEFRHDLKRFLSQQIEKASAKNAI